ncbi:MAG: type II secretion system protein GspN [Byssovorax sp.]
MKERLIKVAKLLAYPAFYIACLGIFGYLTFPADKLKDRIIAEFDRTAKPGQRLEIDRLSTYWLSGVALSGVKITLPPDEPSPPPFGGTGYDGDPIKPTPAAAPKDSVITIDEAHARVRLLPLLLGRVRVDFWASVLGGEIKGTVPIGSGGGDVSVELDQVEIGKIEPLAQAVGLPIKGVATGKLEISAVDGKFSKANGGLDLSISDIVVGDGKSKIMGLLELPAAKLGTLTLNAEAKEGVLKITKLTATGVDLELAGDGRIAMREPATDSNLDLYLKFKFTDAYRGKNDTTKSLLGEPGAALPGLMEMQVPKMKKAKRADGFYGFHVYGPMKKLKFDPSATDITFSTPMPGGTGPSKVNPRKVPDLKKPGLNLPLGGSQAKPSKDDDNTATSPPATPPVLPPPTRPKIDLGDIKIPEGVKVPEVIKQPEPKQPEVVRQPDPPPPPPPPPPQEQPPPDQVPQPDQPAPDTAPQQ